MKGRVVDINQQRGMVAVLTEDEGYSIIELLADGVEVGDELQWADPHPLGHETITNLTQDERIEVFLQNHWVSEDQLRQQLLYE